jgi:hypothetical protein
MTTIEEPKTFGEVRTEKQKTVDALVKERVLRGIELLNEHIPGWEDRIDCQHLLLANADQCVLGQLFGDYEEGTSALELSTEDAVDHGFLLSDYDGGAGINYTLLTHSWKQEIC